MSTVIVSGFPRCGSSLVMQMLAAGGMPVFHDPGMGYPSFETNLNLGCSSIDFLDGYALKWLEPQHAMPPRTSVEIRTIWMTRDHKQQARSAAKFLHAVSGIDLDRSALRQFKASYDRDEKPSVALWRNRGAVMVLSFERLLGGGESCAAEIARFVGLDLSVTAMAGEIRPRSAQCLPGLLEVDLIEAKRRTA